jgi:hypothetical protein
MQFSEGRLQSIDRSVAAVKTSEAAKLSDPAFSTALQERYRSYLRLVDREADLREEMEDVRKKLQPPRAAAGRSGPGEPPPRMTPLTTTEMVHARLPVLYRDTSRWWVAVVEEDSPEGRVDIRVEWPSPGQELRASRKALFVRRGVSEGAAHQQHLIRDESQREYAFVVEAPMLAWDVQQVLTKELGVAPLNPALKLQQSFAMEITAIKTRLESRTIEYRLLAGGATVSVKETGSDADPVK